MRLCFVQRGVPRGDISVLPGSPPTWPWSSSILHRPWSSFQRLPWVCLHCHSNLIHRPFPYHPHHSLHHEHHILFVSAVTVSLPCVSSLSFQGSWGGQVGETGPRAHYALSTGTLFNLSKELKFIRLQDNVLLWNEVF